ncbi:MAG: hypothetical protein CME38_03600 [Haliea sp.]|nr:hypothetical protein [Haliea sp.]
MTSGGKLLSTSIVIHEVEIASGYVSIGEVAGVVMNIGMRSGRKFVPLNLLLERNGSEGRIPDGFVKTTQ